MTRALFDYKYPFRCCLGLGYAGAYLVLPLYGLLIYATVDFLKPYSLSIFQFEFWPKPHLQTSQGILQVTTI